MANLKCVSYILLVLALSIFVSPMLLHAEPIAFYRLGKERAEGWPNQNLSKVQISNDIPNYSLNLPPPEVGVARWSGLSWARRDIEGQVDGRPAEYNNYVQTTKNRRK